MNVYRLCNESEINEILNTKSFINTGKICNNNVKLNNHKYKSNQRYLHFFRNKDSLFYLNLKQGTYICIYDIPIELLEKYNGIGYYLDILFMEKLEGITEYAIPSDEIVFNYLQKVDKVINYIDFEDSFNFNYKNKLETVYDITQKIKILKKSPN